MKKISPAKLIPPAESAPALPSTPVQKPADASWTPSTSPDKAAPVENAVVPARKFIKTLRLTSDQLASALYMSIASLSAIPSFRKLSTSNPGLTPSPSLFPPLVQLRAPLAFSCGTRQILWSYRISTALSQSFSVHSISISVLTVGFSRSDGLGHVFTMIGRDWTHLGVAKLYTDIARNGYKIMYLTSRAIGQADATRDYLKGIKQNDYRLPEGPVIMSPDRLMTSLHRLVCLRSSCHR